MGIYVQNSIGPLTEVIKVGEYSVWVQVKGGQGIGRLDYAFGCVYVKPYSALAWASAYNEWFEGLHWDIAEAKRYRTVCVLGDFNAHTGDLVDVVDQA